MIEEADVRIRVAEAYDAHYDVMRFIAARRFRVSQVDIRPMIHDVFVAFIRHHARIGDERSWLVTSITNACLNYWRDRKGAELIGESVVDPRRLADDVLARVDVAHLLSRVPQRCRNVLYLRYVEGLEPAEIAARYAMSAGYARILLHRCLRVAREALAHLADGGKT